MAVYDKYPGYVIKQREENTGSLNPYGLNVDGFVTNTEGTTSDLGVFTQREIPFLFHQLNVPSLKTGQPYRVYGNNTDNGDDETETWDDYDPRKPEDLFITGEFIYPEINQQLTFFTVPSGKGSFYVTSIFFKTTAVTVASPVVLHFSIGTPDSTFTNNICQVQVFTSPAYGVNYIGKTFRVPFQQQDPQPNPDQRGPFVSGTQFILKNGGSFNPNGIKCVFIIKGYFV